MHKKSLSIISNLGYSEDVVKSFKKDIKTSEAKSLFATLRKLGLPEDAIKQIKDYEDLGSNLKESLSNKDLIKELLKRCRRSLDAFAQKNNSARIIFKNKNWTIFGEEYSKAIQKLHETCKYHFDNFAIHNLDVTLVFDGSTTWRIIAPNESDLPDSV